MEEGKRMNFTTEFTKKELNLLEQAGITIENKNYTKEELEKYQFSIADYIMSHSSKNGDIDKLNNQYRSILEKIR